MNSITEGLLERILEKLSEQLSFATNTELEIPSIEGVAKLLESSDLLAQGRALAALSCCRSLPDGWTANELQLTIHQLRLRVLSREWLETLCSGQHELSVLQFAQQCILDRWHRPAEPATPLQLTVQHVQGLLLTAHSQPPNGLEKLLASLESLNDSSAFLRPLLDLDQSRLSLYNTTLEQVASTLEQVEAHMVIYGNFLEAELFPEPLDSETTADDRAKAIMDQQDRQVQAEAERWTEELESSDNGRTQWL